MTPIFFSSFYTERRERVCVFKEGLLQLEVQVESAEQIDNIYIYISSNYDDRCCFKGGGVINQAPTVLMVRQLYR